MSPAPNYPVCYAVASRRETCTKVYTIPVVKVARYSFTKNR